MNVGIFKKGMGLLAMAFPEKDMMVDFSWQLLKDLTDEQFITAIKLILVTEKQINRATNIIALIREKALTTDKKLSGEAWQEVLVEISKTGSYGIPKFSDPLIKKAVDAVGWRDICLSTNIMVERAHFLKIYDTYVSREQYNQTLGDQKQLPRDIKKMIENIGNYPQPRGAV